MARRVKPTSKLPPSPPTARIGRPRSEVARRAILRAARQLLDAALAGVGKPTVYRWWPDRHAVAMAALMEEPDPVGSSSKGGRALPTLRARLRAIAARFASGSGRHAATLIAASDAHSELGRAFQNHFVLARRTEGLALLERARDEGELRRDVDCEVVVDALYGPLFFRLLLGHAPLDARFTDALLEHVLRGARA
jgi:AcrR family transcriptional regulator